MKVIVDTSVWSLALRRKASIKSPQVDTLKSLINYSQVVMLGAVRQELLSGISHKEQFQKIKNLLSAFPDEVLTTNDYELAAKFCNDCMVKGIQASHTDFLIAAVAITRDYAVLSTDKDFTHLAKILPLRIMNS